MPAVLRHLPLIEPAVPAPADLAPSGGELSAEEIVAAYHERTKHHIHRFAASPGYLHCATQPDPFRRYDGASLVRLPSPDAGPAPPYWPVYVADSSDPALRAVHSP